MVANRNYSESLAWREVLALADQAMRSLTALADRQRTAKLIQAIQQVAKQMRDQVGRGVHRNPSPLLVFANPKGKRGAQKFSSNVLAVLYVHDDDGENYAHGFANAELDLETLHDGTVKLGGLPTDTGVEMIAQSDGSVLLRGKHGQRLWDTF